MMRLNRFLVVAIPWMVLVVCCGPVSAFSSVLVQQKTRPSSFSRVLSLASASPSPSQFPSNNHKQVLPTRQSLHETRKTEWIDRSVDYYSKVMREERRRHIGQAPVPAPPEYQEQFVHLAKKHYFALCKIKTGNLFWNVVLNETCDS